MSLFHAKQPLTQDSHGYLPGFEPFNGGDYMPKVVTKYLTKALSTNYDRPICPYFDTEISTAKLTKPISQEATIAFRDYFSDSAGRMQPRHTAFPQNQRLTLPSQSGTR